MSTVFGSHPANEYWLTVRWISDTPSHTVKRLPEQMSPLTCEMSQVGPPEQRPGSEASTFRESTDAQFWKTSAITSSHFVSTYRKRCSVPFNVEGNEAENDAVCPSLP